jgi:5-methylcytosine-specific restriction endonuclease McrA
MPTINRPEKKKKEYDVNRNDDNYNYIYHTGRWQQLRLTFLTYHPLCGRCLEKGKISSAVEVHHKIPLSSAKDIDRKIELGFDIDNLEGLCKECHIEHHKKNRLR